MDKERRASRLWHLPGSARKSCVFVSRIEEGKQMTERINKEKKEELDQTVKTLSRLLLARNATTKTTKNMLPPPPTQ